MWTTTSCSSWEKLWRAFECEFWGPQGVCYGQLTPAQNPCHTRIRLLGILPPCSIPLSVFLPLSFCLSLLLSLSPSSFLCLSPLIFCNVSTETESKYCWLNTYILMGYVWKDFHCWPVPSIILAVAEGDDISSIVFMAFGDSQASVCFSMFLTQWQTASVTKNLNKNSQFIIGLLYRCQHCMAFRIHILL